MCEGRAEIRASDGSLVMKKIKDEQLMTQGSSLFLPNGNRQEYLEAELHYDRTFGGVTTLLEQYLNILKTKR